MIALSILAIGFGLGALAERALVLRYLKQVQSRNLKQLTDPNKNRPFAYVLINELRRAVTHAHHWRLG